MRAHLRLYPAGFYYSSSVWERDHTKVECIISYVSTLVDNAPAMAGPAGMVPAPMTSYSYCKLISFGIQEECQMK